MRLIWGALAAGAIALGPGAAAGPRRGPGGNRGTATLRFQVRLSAAVTYPVSVRYATRVGTPKTPGDFSARSGTLTFEPGATQRVVAVPVKGDRKIEPNERLTLLLSGHKGARIVDGTAVGTIRNDD